MVMGEGLLLLISVIRGAMAALGYYSAPEQESKFWKFLLILLYLLHVYHV